MTSIYRPVHGGHPAVDFLAEIKEAGKQQSRIVAGIVHKSERQLAKLCVMDGMDTTKPPAETAKPADIGTALNLLWRLLDENHCRIDHNGFCQEHFCSTPCPHGDAYAFLQKNGYYYGK